MDGKPFTKVARSNEKDIDRALVAAHEAAKEWNKAPAADRSAVLNKIADIMEENLEFLARLETMENGKPIRETLNADLPLAVDHYRYFAAAVRTEEETISEHEEHTVSIQLPESLGEVYGAPFHGKRSV